MSELLDQKYVTVSTYGPDGSERRTQSFFVADGTRMLVVERRDAGLTQRMAAGGRVSVTPCTTRGRTCGPSSVGMAKPLDAHATAVARERLVGRYGVVAKALTSQRGLPAPDLVGVVIEFTREGEDPPPTRRSVTIQTP